MPDTNNLYRALREELRRYPKIHDYYALVYRAEWDSTTPQSPEVGLVFLREHFPRLLVDIESERCVDWNPEGVGPPFFFVKYIARVWAPVSIGSWKF